MRRADRLWIWLGAAAIAASATAATGQPHVVDRFGRGVDSNGITLVDWDGYLANPLLRFSLRPPAGATYPVFATLSSSGVRLYFDQPSTVGTNGPSKSLTFADSTPLEFGISIFPDRDGAAESYQLDVQFVDAANVQTNVSVPISVVDQDLATSPPFSVTVDFSQDTSGFYDTAARRDVVRQAVEDWAYFLEGMNLDEVAAGDESTFIWNYPLAWTGPDPQGYFYESTAAYTGFLLYTYGIDTDEVRSGGEPGLCCFQSAGGNTIDLRRSGGVEIEVKGNYNELGWFLTTSDDDWYTSANLGDEANDLYSIAHHECGHCMAFNSGYPNFSAGENEGFDDEAVVAYQGEAVSVDGSDHFNGYIDRLSRAGAFGYEYFGDVPRRRWLITKLDLLLMQAVGYELRQTSAFVPLSIPAFSLPNGVVGAAYLASVPAAGGVPFYDWTIDTGALPAGLTLNRFTGQISGTPTATGTSSFVIRVREYDDGAGVTSSRAIAVCVRGDMDNNGTINGADIREFVQVKLTGSGTAYGLCAADLAFAAFVQLLLGT